MSDTIGWQMDGLEGLIQELERLPDRMQARIMKGAVATGASVIRKAAIALAPVSTFEGANGKTGKQAQNFPPGTLKRSIYQIRLTDECTRDDEAWKIDVRIGSRNLKSGRRAGAYYATFVEYGHGARQPKPKAGTGKADGKQAPHIGIGHVPAHPFMRPAFERESTAALVAMQEYINQHITAGDLALQYLETKGVI
jgi:HK97 gp10 family phage protein